VRRWIELRRWGAINAMELGGGAVSEEGEVRRRECAPVH
jgi:hypothetical protein